MENLLIITQKVDQDDDLLGFFVSWLKEFANNFDRVFVITLGQGSHNLPKNVFIYSLGKEFRSSKIKMFIKFYWYLFRLIPKSDGVFIHMSPIFAVLSWPVATIFRKRIVLWYLHRSVTRRLKLAEKLCYKIVTSTAESLNIKSKKIIEVGHGIDVQKFKTERKQDNLNSREVRILSVGRISRIKNYETLIKAVKILKDNGLTFKVNIIGRPIMDYDIEYFDELKKMVKDLELEGSIEFTGFIPYSGIAGYYKEADIFVNLAPKGGIDKVVLEAMAAGSLTLVANEIFKRYFGDFNRFLIFKHGAAGDLAEKIQNLLNLPEQKTKHIIDYLEESVIKNHNLSDTVRKISELL
ncbi:MAG: glycosyltransferase family 4 protein [Patescibacteria group bacterium]